MTEHLSREPRVTGRPRVIDAWMTLRDTPISGEETAARLSTRLLRLQRVDETLHWLCGEVSDLGLGATWSRLESVDDDIDAAIAVLKVEIANVAGEDSGVLA